MNYKKIDAKIGDTLKVSDSMALRFEKFADDLQPVWHEIPVEESTRDFENGSYVPVTEDCWFVFDNGYWRMMTLAEHAEASRQAWYNNH